MITESRAEGNDRSRTPALKGATRSDQPRFPSLEPLFEHAPVDKQNAASASFRPIHYLGSKLRVLGEIHEALDDVASDMGPVCDLFAGSGTVAASLAPRRRVIAVDIQEYSRVLCSALLSPAVIGKRIHDNFLSDMGDFVEQLACAAEPLIEYEDDCMRLGVSEGVEALCDVLDYGSILAFQSETQPIPDALRRALELTVRGLKESGLASSSRGLITRYFGGRYFSFRQAVEIDAILEAIAKVPFEYRDTLLAALLSTASDVVNTVGKQFAQPIRPRTATGRPKLHLVNQIIRDRSMSVFEAFENWLARYSEIPRTDGRHRAVKEDYATFLQSCVDELRVVYADPPYTRDHYSRFYHVLETMCLRDNPAVSTNRVRGQQRMSRGAYRTHRHQSPFCIKSQAPGAFQKLFRGVRRLEVPLVMSYSPYSKDNGSRPRLMTLNEIREMAEKEFAHVEITGAGRVAHNKLNTRRWNVAQSDDAEVLVICEP